ncbi:hypothetical protein CO154_02260 [Candidatus Pacearchaeota archaeon CG_4_9_14_3_um_filter_31_7]|nr:MAG: hypothetical protein AUJ10_02290 [Candidatus Pacearchaeota archaeon CG1_02_31_27]PIN92520.1 MAG: hypothetical protein COU55_01815 [Candidatus Pacearchaeota archaeon CG10_big_fil_rev_8_21_14_0_10_31_59]PIZ80835.1 MAG: hypothetical protein COX99_01635 [Candidatus Pacearchaeota archaeon CG_4_10_14_0_2_um_filter_31_10]PJA70557.1 MAG: hypothetical protein CO154_02260 [Candidatus Pacearchaeota archaeon CG_4_9_14_3_um_filter_31_7]
MKFNIKWLGIIGIIILIYLLIKTDLKTLWQTIITIDIIWLIPAFIFLILTTIINSARWKYIVEKLNMKISLKEATVITFKAMFGEHSPGKMGEMFVRAAYLKDKIKESWGKIIFSVVFSRFVDIWVTAIEAVIAVLFLLFLFGIKSSIIFPVLGVLVLIIIVFILLKNEKIFRKILKPIYKFIMPKKYREDFDKSFDNFYDGFKNINFMVLFICFLYDLVALLTVAFCFYFLGLALNIHFPLHLTILAEPLMTIAVSLPISFSGLGAREAVFAFLFSLIGVGVETAIIFSLLFFILRNLVMVPGIIMILIEKKSNKEIHK